MQYVIHANGSGHTAAPIDRRRHLVHFPSDSTYFSRKMISGRGRYVASDLWPRSRFDITRYWVKAGSFWATEPFGDGKMLSSHFFSPRNFPHTHTHRERQLSLWNTEAVLPSLLSSDTLASLSLISVCLAPSHSVCLRRKRRHVSGGCNRMRIKTSRT